jgi:hypothetical protein
MTDSTYNSDETTDIDVSGSETADIDVSGTETTDVDATGAERTSAGTPEVERMAVDTTGADSTDTQTPAFLPPRRSIWGPLWEHQIIYTDFDMVDEGRLNALGEERWELMSMAPLPNERFQFVFRRSR